MKIVLAGPPKSGKSCLREGLKQAILTLNRQNSDVPYPYVITACPDGEGAWFQETTAQYPEVAKACKEAYKNEFTSKFTDLVAHHVSNCKQPLTLVDIGGLTSDDNHKICRDATHIVILAGNDPETGESWDSRMAPWREFAGELDLCPIAEIFSDYDAKTDVFKDISPENVLRGSVHHLERGEDVGARPTIQALARHILSMMNIPLESISGGGVQASTYNVNKDAGGILRVAFGSPGRNDQIVKDAVTRLDEMIEAGELSGGGLLKINGPASLPVAMVLGHKLSHLFEAIACFDPKLDKYVVVISHGPKWSVGDLLCEKIVDKDFEMC